MDNYVVISKKVPEICCKFQELKFNLIYTDHINELIDYESEHADMQCINCCGKIFVLKNAKNLFNRLKNLSFNVEYTSTYAQTKYPDNILLNALLINKNVIGNIAHLDSGFKEFAKNNGYKFINVNQGYSACSCCKISEKAIITSDKSIYNALVPTDIEVLKIRSGHITLFGAKRGEHGFIGGASALIDNENVLFFGNITEHPDYDLISNFCKKHKVNILQIQDIPLTDIGGGILLKN